MRILVARGTTDQRINSGLTTTCAQPTDSFERLVLIVSLTLFEPKSGWGVLFKGKIENEKKGQKVNYPASGDRNSFQGEGTG